MLTDRITVLRDGEFIKTVSAEGVTQDELVEMMVGRSLDNIYPKEAAQIREAVLEVRNFTSKGVFEDISFTVHAGEILGFSGLVGAGRSEIMNSIFGIDKIDSGELYMEGRKITIKNPSDAIANKIAMVSEDRKIRGLVLCRSIKENISLPNLHGRHPKLFISGKREKREVEEYSNALGTKCSSIQVAAGNLSGGNQQKVIVGKWMAANAEMIIFDEPTKGIDIGTKTEMYRIMRGLAQKGIGVIMISSEMPELLGICDRIMVLNDGRLKGILNKEEVTEERILQTATM